MEKRFSIQNCASNYKNLIIFRFKNSYSNHLLTPFLLSESEREFEQKIAEIKSTFASQREKIITEFEKIQSQLQTEVEDQECQLESWKKRWEIRGPRKEDREKMSELESIINEKDSVISRLVDDKKFYQLELANRDRNFNQLCKGASSLSLNNILRESSL